MGTAAPTRKASSSPGIATDCSDTTDDRPSASGTEHNVAGFLIPLVAGGALAAYNPKLGMAAGGGTLVIAATFKKGWAWWAVGAVVLALALFFYWSKQNTQDSQPDKTNGDAEGRAETEQP